VARQNNTRQLKVKLFPAISNSFHVASAEQFNKKLKIKMYLLQNQDMSSVS